MASPAMEARNARARALGFRNDYERRTRKTPGAPKPSREELRRRRGHAGPADLIRLVQSGRVETINVVQTSFTPATFDLLVRTADGRQLSFTLKGRGPVTRFRDVLDAMGPDAPQITGSPGAKKRLLEEDEELEAELAAAEEEDELGETPADFSDDDIPF